MDDNAVFNDYRKRPGVWFRMGADAPTPRYTHRPMLAAELPARAQHMNQKDSPCADVIVTVDLANCLVKAHAADAKLNATYEQLRGKFDIADAQRLVAAQRLWIQYRDANCVAERALYEGGTASTSRLPGLLGSDGAGADQGTDGHIRGQAEVGRAGSLPKRPFPGTTVCHLPFVVSAFHL